MGSLGGEEREQLGPERIAIVEVWKRIQENSSGLAAAVRSRQTISRR
jgi:hypothetical protein